VKIPIPDPTRDRGDHLGPDDLSEHQQILQHMVFDGEDGRRKGRLVAGRSHTVIASEQVLSGVVDIGSV
jgi:hypothetical protein